MSSPAIYVIHNFVRLRLPMLENQIFPNPGNQMILESPLNELMKQVGRQHLVNIGTREVICEWLKIESESSIGTRNAKKLTTISSSTP
jgi:hypothetical protein